MVPVGSHPAVVETKSATSAQRLATLPETALRLVDTVPVVVADMADSKEATVVVASVAVVKVDRPATLAVVTATCQGTAPKVKSATTAEKLDT